MVELAITLPVIILLFSGLVEFGFILNYYLSLLDATRESARIYSTQDPFMTVGNSLEDNVVFYESAASMVYGELQPHDALDTTRKVILNPATDDIIVSVFNVENTGSANPANVCNPDAPNPEKTITRYPTNPAVSPVSGSYHAYGNHSTGLSTSDICAHLISGSSPTALLLVEIYYTYTPILAITAPILNVAAIKGPVALHAYSLMPMPPISLARQAPPAFAFSFLPPWEQ